MDDDLFQVAIDGPVGSGKSTVAKLVAERMGWLYVYTGAMYRAGALLAKKAGVSWINGRSIAALIDKAKVEMRNPQKKEKDGRVTTLLLDGKDVSWEIMSEELSKGSSEIAVHKEVREALVRLQQEIAGSASVVMEGRDTTFRVLPGADLKIFLTADEKERAGRRHKQLKSRGKDVEFGRVFNDLKNRDRRDSERKIDPLQVVPGAWVLDTSNLSIDEVVEKIVEKIGKIRAGN